MMNFILISDLQSEVPQYGIPLFPIFINRSTRSLYRAYHLYADNLQLYVQADIDLVFAAIPRSK